MLVLQDSDPTFITEQLNLLGEERWECFFVDRTEDGLMFYFKKERISYLQKVSELKVGTLIGSDER